MMSDYDYSFDQQNDFQNQLRKQCDVLLESVDLKEEANRQWVAKCYRHLNQLVSENSKVKFNLSNDCRKLPDIATKYAFSIRPFQFDRGIQTFSKQVEESYAGKKKCEMPLVYRSINSQWQLQKIENGTVSIKQNSHFNLRIEAEENSTIIVTHENNHPLRVKPEFQYNYFQKAILQINPPCLICAVVVKEQSYTVDGPNNQQRTQTVPFKLPSNPIRIQIRKTNSKEGNLNYLIRGLGQQYMVRPEETFDHGLSSSQGSNMHPFIGIQIESRSRD